MKHYFTVFSKRIDGFIDENLSNEVIKAQIKAFINCKNKLKQGRKKIKIGSLLINPRRRKVTKKGIEIDLTKIEYDILSMLAQDPSKIFLVKRYISKFGVIK